jgi:hypothetical protein
MTDSKNRVNPSADEYYVIDAAIRNGTTQDERDNGSWTVLTEGTTWDALAEQVTAEVNEEGRVFSADHLKRRLGGKVFAPWCPEQRKPKTTSANGKVAHLEKELARVSENYDALSLRFPDVIKELNSLRDQVSQLSSMVATLSAPGNDRRAIERDLQNRAQATTVPKAGQSVIPFGGMS